MLRVCFADGSQSRVYPGDTRPRTENEAESPGKKRREGDVKNGLSLIRTYSKRISRVVKGRQSFLLAIITRDIKNGDSFQHKEANNHASATDISGKMEKVDETIGLLSQPTDVLEDGNDLNTIPVQSKKSSNNLRKLEPRRSALLPLLICSGDNVEYRGGVLEAVGPSNSDREIGGGRRMTTYESAWLKCEETQKFETIPEFEAIDRYPTKLT